MEDFYKSIYETLTINEGRTFALVSDDTALLDGLNRWIMENADTSQIKSIMLLTNPVGVYKLPKLDAAFVSLSHDGDTVNELNSLLKEDGQLHRLEFGGLV